MFVRLFVSNSAMYLDEEYGFGGRTSTNIVQIFWYSWVNDIVQYIGHGNIILIFVIPTIV